MAETSFRLPRLLNVTDGNVTENFQKWKREFEVYMTATGSDKKNANVRVAILLHCARPNILDIYDQATWEDPGHKDDPVKVLQMKSIVTPAKMKFMNRPFVNLRVKMPSGNGQMSVTKA
ncbi:hypothetical protein DPMN_048342 [Dreissena polymorpha]|uniref:Uncharacterized protein n=1 Tax=Dreissena polymorpha TaxID=45954 RepID=A0A9D4DAH8_DREPO|nr:hypothetical protein DPMN_048342 [Dreissena polymorpha]